MTWEPGPDVYAVSLVLMSLAVAGLERLFPRRPMQHLVRPRLGWDLLSLVLHARVVGGLLAVFAQQWILPWTEGFWSSAGMPRALASALSFWVQVVVALVVVDFFQWWVHRALHAWGPLWEFHKIHHSIESGEMDWLGSFRFHWMESVVYKTALYVPLGLLGFSPGALMVHALVGTWVGHLNHANLDWGHGGWRYVLNSPRMHLWHHDAAATRAVNFGIIFSAWDWLFGTAHLPDGAPARLGFVGHEQLPRGLPAQWLWPLSKLVLRKPRAVEV